MSATSETPFKTTLRLDIMENRTIFYNELELSSKWRLRSWSDLGLCPWDWSTRYCTTAGATITSRSTVRIRINFWRMVGLYISFGDWANALECWRSPSLRLVIPGIAAPPGVTHSDSRIVFVTGTVVKPQQHHHFYNLSDSLIIQSYRTLSLKAKIQAAIKSDCWPWRLDQRLSFIYSIK